MTELIITSFIVIVFICTVALIRGATMPECPEPHIPNKLTAETLEKSKRGEDVHRAVSADDFLDSLWNEPLPVGWQGWEGGEQPICSGTSIMIMQRNGVMVEAYADAVRWWHVCDIEPSLYSAEYDVVAWRVAD